MSPQHEGGVLLVWRHDAAQMGSGRERLLQEQQEQEFLINRYPHLRPEVILDTLRNMAGQTAAAMDFIDRNPGGGFSAAFPGP